MNKQTPRQTKMIQWHSEGFTQQETATKLGLTRQRVQQIEKNLGLIREKSKGPKHPKVCLTCHKKFLSLTTKRRFCSRECFYASRKIPLTPEQLLEKQEERKIKTQNKAALYYHNVFKKKKNWQSIVKERNLKYAAHATV